MANLKPQGYRGYDSKRNNMLAWLRTAPETFTLDWLKWAAQQTGLPSIKLAIQDRIKELEGYNG